ncbi:MAG: hypothetical protein ABIT01_12445, partial [Thermoanaerobaculia bacterium]
MLKDIARDAIEKGKETLHEQMDGLVGDAKKRGKDLAKRAKKKGMGLLALAAEQGLDRIGDWSDTAPKLVPWRKRSSGISGRTILGVVLGAAAVGFLVLAQNEEKKR